MFLIKRILSRVVGGARFEFRAHAEGAVVEGAKWVSAHAVCNDSANRGVHLANRSAHVRPYYQTSRRIAFQSAQ